jgi:hypothetical protein
MPSRHSIEVEEIVLWLLPFSKLHGGGREMEHVKRLLNKQKLTVWGGKYLEVEIQADHSFAARTIGAVARRELNEPWPILRPLGGKQLVYVE